ncbi:MAG: hypothetical protein J5634_00930 [Bacilli bacterium]|nr:hypothetical protein [Bacilli bacterium]
MLDALGTFIQEGWINMCLTIDRTLSIIIYSVFSVFTSLSQTKIISNDLVNVITSRAYIVLSISMLFVLTYSILKMIINPDEGLKGKSSGLSVVKHVIIAVMVIVFTPTMFDFSYGLQRSILKNNVIGRTIMGSNEDYVGNAGSEFITSLFTANCYLTESASEAAEDEYYAAVEASRATGDIASFKYLTEYIVNDEVEYHNFISLICSGFVFYMIITFCFDLAIRVVKLAFLQLIAPIPAILYIIPGKQDSLGKWVKNCLASYFEVFIRVAILYFTMFLFLVINKKIDSGLIVNSAEASSMTNYYFIVKLFVIFGLLMFTKQAPRMIEDLFGIKMDGKMFDLKSRIKDLKSSAETFYNPVKKGATDVAHGASKLAGAVGGVAFARKAYNESKVDGSPLRSALSTFNGARIGFKGGIRSMGSAYKYEQLMQQSYAIQDQEGLSDKQVVARAIGDRTRKFIGRESRYDEKLMQLSIERDLKTAGYKKSIENINETVGEKIQEIEGQHKDTMDANKKTKEFASAVDDAAEKNVSKKDSGYKVSFSGNDGMFETYKAQLNKDLEDAKSEGNTVKITQLQKKLEDLNKLEQSNAVLSDSELSIEGMSAAEYKTSIQQEYNKLSAAFNRGELNASDMTRMTQLKGKVDMINKLDANGALKNGDEFIKYKENLESRIKLAREQGNTAEEKNLQLEYDQLSDFEAKSSTTYGQFYDVDSQLNWYEIENRIKQLEKSDMDADLKSALVGMYSEAQKNLKTQYLNDKQNWDTDTKIAVSNFETHIKGDADCGKIVDEHGKPIQVENFQKILSEKSFGEAVSKIKKASNTLVNDETIIKNNQLAGGEPIQIEIYDEATKTMKKERKSLYEFKDISETFGQKIKDENLIVEKYKESHETELNAQNTQKAAGDIYKNTKRVHIAHHKNNGKQ